MQENEDEHDDEEVAHVNDETVRHVTHVLEVLIDKLFFSEAKSIAKLVSDVNQVVLSDV